MDLAIKIFFLNYTYGNSMLRNTASPIQLNNKFSVNYYFSIRIMQELLIVYSYKFICVLQQLILFHFTLILQKLKHVLITADLLNRYPTKKVMLLFRKLF